MRQVAFQVKMDALELYLKGLSMDEVVEKTGISKGAVVSIVKNAREGKFPHLELKDRIDELHSLATRLRKEEIDLPQARLGFTFVKKILELGVEPRMVKDWVDFCSRR